MYSIILKEQRSSIRRLSKDNFELWKKKVTASKPKPKPMVDDDFDDLDGKYYMKNKFD